MNAGLSAKNQGNIESEFAVLCEDFCAYLSRYGRKLSPYKDRSVSLFAALATEDKLRVMEQIKTVLEIYSEVEANGEKISNSAQLMWRAFSKLKLTPCSDVFDKMGEDDVIVVYGLDHRQIFRNLQYFDSVSATFEEISTLAWWEIHIYPDDISSQFNALPEAIAAGHIQQTMPFSVPTYKVVEGVGIDKIKVEVTMKWMSPVRSGDQIVGLMNCASMEVMN